MGNYYVVHQVEALELIPLGDDDLEGAVPTGAGRWDLSLIDQPLERGQVLEVYEDGLLATEIFAVQTRVRFTGTAITAPDARGRYRAVECPEQWLKTASGVIGQHRHVDAWRVPAEGPIRMLGLVLEPDSRQGSTVAERHEAAVAARAAARERAALEEANKARAEGVNHGFVNPYNFVPLPDCDPVRSAPVNHVQLDRGNVSGRIDVTFEARTRLALPGPEEHGITRPHFVDGRYILPGSSLGGAVRSFHEALTGSCLRIIDANFRPVHREPARVRDSRWRLAVVEQTAPSVTVKLCDLIPHQGRQYPAVWVEGNSLPGPHTSTARYLGAIAALQTVHGRLEADGAGLAPAPSGGLTRSGEWVPLVTAKGARGRRHPYHLALGQLGSTSRAIRPPVLRDYVLTAENAEDVVRVRRGDPVETLVNHEGFTGTRQTVGETLAVGDVIWVRLNGGEVDRVSRAAIWRTLGDHPLRERIDQYHPCDDPDRLCPSCALFGMTDDVGGDAEGKAEQNAYRGHVRFGDAEVSEIEEQVTYLVRMGQPRPGSSQFYMENAPRWVGTLAGRDQRPLRDWGSAADSGDKPRRIRGRKRYWAVTEAQPRRRLPGHHPDHRHVAAEPGDDSPGYHLVPRGAVLTASVYFDNVTPEQLGALLMSLQPRLLGEVAELESLSALPEAREFVLQLGRGKNVGLGVVATSELKVVAWSESRYDGEAVHHEVTVEDALAAFGDWVQSLGECGVQIKRTWTSLAALSLLDRVPPDAITYPPDDVYRAEYQFDFWKASSGNYLTNNPDGKGFTVLPLADDPDPFIKPRWWT